MHIVFASSGIMDVKSPPGGVSLAELTPGNHSKNKARNYSASKAGNWLLASEFDKRIRKDGIVCVTQSPGTLRTPGIDRMPWAMMVLLTPVIHEPKMGAYTEL
jgi:NAD(P)-dependent dehydrogenase (short-subunit alcohol dehydrogenase family)